MTMETMTPTYPPFTPDEVGFAELVKVSRRIGYGRMMQLISGIWKDQEGDGAHCVNETFAGLALKQKRCEIEGHDIGPDTAGWCDRCGVKVQKA